MKPFVHLSPLDQLRRRRHQLITLPLIAVLISLVLPGQTAVSLPGPFPFAAVQPGQSLSLETRVACQTAIEEIYWQRRIWPADNPDSKPPLSTVMPTASIEAKVRDNLAKSQALAIFWRQPITATMLQAEINRQATTSRQPETLQQLWAALGNDPVLVAECLARPALAERLLSSWFAGDERFAAQPFADWWKSVKAEIAPDLHVPQGQYDLPSLAQTPVQDDTWQPTAAIPAQVEGRSVWTGAEMLYLGQFSTQGHRYNPATDTWATLTTIDAPHNVSGFTAVWTGTEMITWGGCTGSHEFCTTPAGGRYNLATDTWTPTDLSGAPGPRRWHGAVWTGTEMVIWGGCTENSSGNQNCAIILNDGGRYDPTTNSWQMVTTNGAPVGRTHPELVWTDDEMILWSGAEATSPGGRYNPDTNTWQGISTSNAPGARSASLIWTGTEMIAWGGCTGFPFCTVPFNTGGRYHPASNTWSSMDSTGAPAARWDHRAVWTGSEMIVWGGNDGSQALNEGSRYDPLTDDWTPISTTGAPLARQNHQMLWTGSEMLVWGGRNLSTADSTRNGARYNPATNSWTPISGKDANSFRSANTTIWTGVEMIAWGGVGDGIGSGLDTGRRYDPVTDSWTETSTVNTPSPRSWHTAVWTGTEMIIWGGDTASWPTPGTGGRYNPMTDSWTATSTTAAPEAMTNHSAIWTGDEMIVWGGSVWDLPTSNAGGRYNPSSNSWTSMSDSGEPVGRYLHTAVWTGDEMIVWGGAGSTGMLADGGRYKPSTNTWTATNAPNAPIERVLHTAVWTGNEMIIWGGAQDYSPWILLNSGARYNPATDSWTATSTSNVPEPVGKHTAVWTGDEMIVWGGCQDTSNCLHGSYQGGRYDPQNNSWMTMNTAGSPEARLFHTAVWTGNEMIVWSGETERNGYGNTGGRYYAFTSGNNAPQAESDTYAMLASTTLTVTAPGILANDSDPDGDPLTAVLVNDPAHGDLIFNADGSLTYTPEAGFSGADTFTYQANDGSKLSNAAVVGIVVEAVNHAPVALADSYESHEDGVLHVMAPGVLANDSDLDEDGLTAVLLTTTAQGTLVLASDGALTYTPIANFFGEDSFSYQATDGLLTSEPVIVTIGVTALNDAPTAVADNYQVLHGQTLHVTAPGILLNDSDIDGDALTATLQTEPGNGSISLNADGSFVYTPEADFSGTDNLTYSIQDGHGGEATATIIITVTTTPLFLTYLPLVQGP